MSNVLSYAISGTSLVLTAVSTGAAAVSAGAAVWQIQVKRREWREAAQKANREEEGEADTRVMALASGIQNTWQTQDGIKGWASRNHLNLELLHSNFRVPCGTEGMLPQAW